MKLSKTSRILCIRRVYKERRGDFTRFLFHSARAQAYSRALELRIAIPIPLILAVFQAFFLGHVRMLNSIGVS